MDKKQKQTLEAKLKEIGEKFPGVKQTIESDLKRMNSKQEHKWGYFRVQLAATRETTVQDIITDDKNDLVLVLYDCKGWTEADEPTGYRGGSFAASQISTYDLKGSKFDDKKKYSTGELPGFDLYYWEGDVNMKGTITGDGERIEEITKVDGSKKKILAEVVMKNGSKYSIRINNAEVYYTLVENEQTGKREKVLDKHRNYWKNYNGFSLHEVSMKYLGKETQ
jgi:hypothetical protein